MFPERHFSVWKGSITVTVCGQYMNFFQPTMKLCSKARYGAKVHKVYETAQTPYQRLLQPGVLGEFTRAEMAATYSG